MTDEAPRSYSASARAGLPYSEQRFTSHFCAPLALSAVQRACYLGEAAPATVCVDVRVRVWPSRLRMWTLHRHSGSAAGEALIPRRLFRRPSREARECRPQATSPPHSCVACGCPCPLYAPGASPCTRVPPSSSRDSPGLTHQGFCVLRRRSPAASSSVQSAAALPPRCLLSVCGAGRPAGAAQSSWRQWHQLQASLRRPRRQCWNLCPVIRGA